MSTKFEHQECIYPQQQVVVDHGVTYKVLNTIAQIFNGAEARFGKEIAQERIDYLTSELIVNVDQVLGEHDLGIVKKTYFQGTPEEELKRKSVEYRGNVGAGFSIVYKP